LLRRLKIETFPTKNITTLNGKNDHV
jgi:hypothetical protein